MQNAAQCGFFFFCSGGTTGAPCSAEFALNNCVLMGYFINQSPLQIHLKKLFSIVVGFFEGVFTKAGYSETREGLQIEEARSQQLE